MEIRARGHLAGSCLGNFVGSRECYQFWNGSMKLILIFEGDLETVSCRNRPLLELGSSWLVT